ncbi:uncharacterized protein BDV14DRAFT_143356 [Aspergillus stella-maris]|uniref:uncharacterized protein n=1 Tax=Aspergillus stella-maris TaxID=1810926 RepID=UPI003CCE4C78
MPPLSVYTPLESLLFFQSLAANDTRPISFASISDLLRNNKFVRENGAFDAHRLSPEALEDLYSSLMRDGGESGLSQEPNGHHSESSPSNSKKRKIATPRPDGLSDEGKRKAGFMPFLVPHLYAKYKELATAEIRQEEKRFRDIKREIERLEREEREAPREKPAPPVTTPIQTKPESAPEPMDLDTNEAPVKQPQPTKEQQPTPVKPAEVKPSPLGSQLKSQPAPPPTQAVPQPSPLESKPPAQPVAQQPGVQKNLQSQSQPQTQVLPQQPPLQPQPTPQQKQPQPQTILPQQGQAAAVPSQPPRQPQLPNGKGPTPLQPPNDTPQKATVQDKTTNTQPPQPQKQQATPVAVAPGPVRAPASTPSQPPQAQQLPNVPTPSTPSKAAPAKTTGKKSAPIAPVPTSTPHGAPQASFQQWSLNQPQPSQPPQPPSSSTPQLAPHSKPLQPPPTQQTPKVERRAQQASLPMATPSTPQPLSRAVFQTPAHPISGFATPSGPAQGFPTTGKPGSRPRLSINTPGSSTPWKQTPHLTLPKSPRSPDRPRPEDVSPISERASSPFGSREVTPEEPEPPRRRGTGRGRKKATDTDQVSHKKKGEKAMGSTGKNRGRSTHSSRSRGRSIVSRDEGSETEAGEVKREIPSTPAGVNTAELERGPSQKGAPGSESRPRGRPKRKRALSEAPEPDTHPQMHPEPSQLSRADSDQSAPFVLCARNFPRTGQPIMNDVLMHKHASWFSKPITDREVNGYRDFIYRPQDLKSIKSSISQGSKSVAAATEAANTPVADGESPVPASGTPSKNATLMLQKTEDIIPPKGIVNSTQLEKELIRMFANSVMFNHGPQRGFGPAFPLAPDGALGPRQILSEPDEGGIVKDTIEMFEDVEKAVTKWRAAERTTDDVPSKSVLSLRRESASDPNMESDDVKG